MLMRIILYSLLALAAILALANLKKFQAFGRAAKRFYGEVKVEMQKVSWPGRNDVIGSTTVVMVAVVALTVVIFTWDWMLSQVMNVLLGLGG